MLVNKVNKWVWLVAAMGLLASTSSQADYLYKGGYYQKRSQGSGYERKYHRNNRYKTIKVRRYIRRVAPRRVAPRRVAPRRNFAYPARNNFRRGNQRPDRGGYQRPYRGNTGQYFNRSRNNGYINRPYRQQRRACRSVESAIWAAQRRYPGGKVINARARRGPYGRTRYIEVRILYRGRVTVVREGC